MTENEALKILKISPEMKKEIPNLAEVYEVAVKALEENQQYRAIGTVEEFKALKEKNKPKKITHEATLKKCCTCPACLNVVDEFVKIGDIRIRVEFEHCYFCGQKLDWSEV